MLTLLKKRFFKKLFLTYVLVLGAVWVIVCGVLWYQKGENQNALLQRDAKAKAEMMVQIIDEKFSVIEQIGLQISGSTWFPYVSSNSEILYSQIDYFKRQEICQNLGNFNALFEISDSMFLYLKRKDLVIDGQSFWDSNRYFAFSKLSTEVLSELNATSCYLNVNRDLILKEGQGNNFIVIQKLTYNGVEKGNLVASINRRQFQRFVNKNALDIVYLKIQQDDQVFFSSLEPKNDEPIIELELPSGQYEWKYQLGVQNSVNNSFEENSLFVAFALLSGIFIDVILSYWLAHVSYKPIARVLKNLNTDQRGEISDLDKLENVYRELVHEKDRMESLANQYYLIGQNNFLISLLQGTFLNNTVSDYARQFNIGFKDEMVYTVVTALNLDKDVERKFLAAIFQLQISALKEQLAVHFCKIDENYVMIIGIEMKEEDISCVKKQVNVLMDDFFSELDVELYLGIPCKGWWGIERSYRYCQEVACLNNNRNQMTYFYPLDMEIRMKNQIQMGNFKEAQVILKKIEEGNKKRDVLPQIQQKVISLIYESIRRFSRDMNLEMDKENEEMDSTWELLSGYLQKVEASYRDNALYDSLGKELVNYVNNNYTSSSISQQGIADCFGISRPAVSKLFKEATNMNFIDYLHKKRVDKAKRLFEQGERDVLKVAKECGYENEVTFKRAFVKHEGITPRAFLKEKK